MSVVFKNITLEHADEWDKIVTSFKRYDVYYLSGYVKGFQIHGDGVPHLLYYESDGLRMINVVMQRDVADCAPFKNVLPTNTYFDITTPYGYGGFLFEGTVTDDSLNTFAQVYTQYMREQGIISEFVRYHPILRNAETVQQIFPVYKGGSTVDIDLTSEDIIWNNLTVKNRTQIRKALNFGVEVKHGTGMDLMEQFIHIYNATMDKDAAKPYYYFEKDFYRSICEDLQGHHELFYAIYEGEIVSMSVVLYANTQMHFHFLGSLERYGYFAPSNLLIYEAICWGSRMGLQTAHLGGGVGARADDLYRFKHVFNRNASVYAFFGNNIYMQDKYDKLVQKRKELDATFLPENDFFPQYRHS